MDRTIKVEQAQSTEVHTYQITLSLEGLPSHDGEVGLGDLIFELQSLNALLLSLDRASSPEHRVSTDYRIVDLKRVNPSLVTIGGTPKEGAPDVRAVVFGEPFETLRRLSAGELAGYDYDLLEDLRNIAQPVGKRLNKASLSWNGFQAELTVDLRERIDKLLEPHYVASGFIQGRIEAANIHGGANSLKLYPRVGPAKITGHFPSSLQPAVGSALGKDVVLHGLMKYRANEPHAYSIDIESIEEFPDPAELPTFHDLRGAMAEVMDGMSSEEWLEQSRKESTAALLMLLER